MTGKITSLIFIGFMAIAGAAGKISSPPVIDGKLTGTEWSSARYFNNFIPTDKGKRVPRERSEAWFGYDDNRIYVAFKCYEPRPETVRTENKRRDGNIWMDDSVELFLDMNRNKTDYYHFIINQAGYVYDQLCLPGEVGAHRDWNAAGLKIATGQGNGFWTVEMSVPLMNFKNIGKEWGINLSRSKQNPVEYSSAAGMKEGFHRPEQFLLFTNDIDRDRYPCSLKIKSVGNRISGKNLLTVVLENHSEKKQKTFLVNEITANGKVFSKNETPVTIPPRSTQEYKLEYILPKSEQCLLTSSLRNGKRVVFTCSRDINLKIEALPIALGKKSGYPVYIDDNKVMVVNGKKVFPLIFYRQPPSTYSEMKKYGFNCAEVTNYAKDPKLFKERLNAAGQAGIGMMCHDDFSGKRFLRSKLKKIVKKYKDHPALWAWYLADEPQNYGITPENAEDLYQVVKKADPGHPVFIVHSEPKLYASYAGACDIFAIDVYPVPLKPLTALSDALALAGKTVKYKKPVWAVLQAYGNFAAGRRAPTPLELRCMTYMSIAHDVKGILWFTWWAPEMKGTLKQQAPELFKEVLKLTGELKSLEPVLTSSPVKQNFKVEAGNQKPLCILKQFDSVRYLFAVNPYPDKIQVRITVPGMRSAESLFEKNNIKVNKSSFKDVYGKYAVRVYKIQ